jgi:hypothetical protein
MLLETWLSLLVIALSAAILFAIAAVVMRAMREIG